MISSKFYCRYVYFLYFYTLVVILWGAWVRISGSGDGCGDHWPLCQGNFIPDTNSLPTWVEYSHRLTSGIFGIAVILLVVFTYRKFPKNHILRKLSVATLILTILEALLGARLVLAGFVADNATVGRAYTMALHLVNSMFLVGSIVLHFDPIQYAQSRWNLSSLKKTLHWGAVVAFLIIGMSGAIAALSTTLFPSEALLSGLAKDFSENSHFLVKVRVSHPLSAILLGGALLVYAVLLTSEKNTLLVRKRGVQLIFAVSSGMVIGIVTLALLSPVVLKLIHLLWAYWIWSALVLCFSAHFMKIDRTTST